MAFVEDGLVRRVIEGAFDFLKFGEVASFDIAQHHLRAKPAGVAILHETGLPFHNLPILVPTRQLAMGHDSKQGQSGMFTTNSR